MNSEVNDALELAKESLETALQSARELAQVLNQHRAGESGMAGARLEAYLIPHLQSWLEDEDQIGSLISTERDIEEAERGEDFDPDEEAEYEDYHGDELEEDDCLTCEQPQSECVCE